MRPRVLFALPACLLSAAGAVAQPAGPFNFAPSPGTPAGPAPVAPSPGVFAGPPASDPGCRPGSPYADLLAGTPPPGPRAWVSAEYLLWWVTPMSTPELIQSVPAAAAGTGSGGELPPGSTTRVFPRERDLEFGAASGFRLSAGGTFRPGGRYGLEASGFLLETQVEKASFAGTGRPVALSREYVEVTTGRPIALFATLADQYAGVISAGADTQFGGVDLNVRGPGYTFFSDRTDYLAGFRYLALAESLAINQTLFFNSGSTLRIQDVIRTRNQFYGGQVGIHSQFNGLYRGLGLDAGFKFAMGGVRQRAELFGGNIGQEPGGLPDAERGGLYARPFNDGVFERDQFAVATDLTLNLTYNFSSRFLVSFGYSLTYLSSVVRPGDAIDTVLNDSRIRYIANPTPNEFNRPAFSFDRAANDFWAQGLNFGLKVQY